MERKYTIRVESHNPEFDVSERLREGIQADGFLLLTTWDGDPAAECMNGMNTMELAKFFDTGTDACSILRQAAAIGEGMQKAHKIREERALEMKRDKMAKEIAEMVAGMTTEEE